MSDHVTSLLKISQWLSLSFRIKAKVFVMAQEDSHQCFTKHWGLLTSDLVKVQIMIIDDVMLLIHEPHLSYQTSRSLQPAYISSLASWAGLLLPSYFLFLLQPHVHSHLSLCSCCSLCLR